MIKNMSNILLFKKISEAAIAVAASDGLHYDEIDSIRKILLNVTRITDDLKSQYDSYGIDHNNIDFSEFAVAYESILNTDIKSFELIEINDEYCKDLANLLNEGPVLHNLCVGMALAGLNADGNVSDSETEAFQLLCSYLNQADEAVVGNICNLLLNNDIIL